MKISFPGESSEYRAARERLLQREIELRRLHEAVAQERRALPPGGVVPEDYVFERIGSGGAVEKVRFSELFAKGKDTLAVYSYMFGPEKEKPCPMCTPMLDGLDGSEYHIRQRLSFVVVAESPAARLQAWKQKRGWKNLQLVSAAGNGFNRAYFGKGDSGDTTMLNVFHRSGTTLRHFWGTELTQAPPDPGQDIRAIDDLNAIFQTFDWTPEGRGDWRTSLEYPGDPAP
jgi:predicted dithiol-disulfide oxidoreductase (DUF899 family)